MFLTILFSRNLHAQFGFSYHESALPFVGINYEAGNRLLTEFRLSTNIYLGDLAIEGIAALKLGRSEELDPYVGLGIRLAPDEDESAIVIPVGINVYPFPRKTFGFHLEFTPLIRGEDFGNNIIRGSWGVRYRFEK
ncbi:hypothetical protein CRP01_03915 [Flavilitoribacter nigricans DSM 23189 = NBRC 102662]|uniref:Uncharacterized protein n=1 Tax=Flavilitoribacter nigricans (strain ATCC 23147 / DSM 23189 / NBRC 102662 / NCIMB 1420 / SS-2) TaxID=1122177 RepID=A0A2D0NI97_FLAN2|nr:hypothetical protein CRP01_03915 [Flavilitoribacter nigricans DSM 23189 = NBRC 102662]